jgi:hypothetical protein
LLGVEKPLSVCCNRDLVYVAGNLAWRNRSPQEGRSADPDRWRFPVDNFALPKRYLAHPTQNLLAACSIELRP